MGIAQRRLGIDVAQDSFRGNNIGRRFTGNIHTARRLRTAQLGNPRRGLKALHFGRALPRLHLGIGLLVGHDCIVACDLGLIVLHLGLVLKGLRLLLRSRIGAGATAKRTDDGYTRADGCKSCRYAGGGDEAQG